jgi:hypothetical protein
VLVIILVPLIIRAKKAATGERMLRGFDWNSYVFGVWCYLLYIQILEGWI